MRDVRDLRSRSRSRIERPVIKPVTWEGNRSTVLYGRSGSGKTTLAATWPKPILLLDIGDRGTDSIADVAKVDRTEVTEWDQFEHNYFWLREEEGAGYKSAVVDTVSRLQRLCEAKVQHIDPQDLEEKSWGSMKRGQWGEVASLMKMWLNRFRDLPMNVVFIAQDRTFNADEDEGDNVLMPEVGPELAPSVAKALNASVSIIGNTFIRSRSITTKRKVKVRKNEYCLRIGPNPIYTTKIRKPKGVELPDVLVDPTYDAIIEVIKGVE